MTTSLPAATEPDPVPATVEEIAARLREDPVLVTTMLGNGARDEVDAALTAKLGATDFPVYVVLTRTPVGLEPSSADEELASLLHAEIGGDGVYVVQTSLGYGHLALWGDLVPDSDQDEVLLSLNRYTARDQVQAALEERWGAEARLAPAVEAGVVLDAVARDDFEDYADDVLTDTQVAAYTDAAWRTYGYQGIGYEDGGEEPVSLGTSTLVGVAAGLTVAVVGFRLLRARGAPPRPAAGRTAGGPAARARAAPPRRSTPPPPSPAPVVELPETGPLLGELEYRLERTSTAKVGAARVDLAQRCLVVARDLLEAHPDPDEDDLLDLLGAEALLRTGTHALTSTSRTWEPYRGCWFDPRHGRARGEAAVAAGLAVPACSPCRRRAQRDRPAEPLLDPRTDQPYYEGDTVWSATGFGALTDDLAGDVAAARAAADVPLAPPERPRGLVARLRQLLGRRRR